LHSVFGGLYLGTSTLKWNLATLSVWFTTAGRGYAISNCVKE